jgi:hypothetical protein
MFFKKCFRFSFYCSLLRLTHIAITDRKLQTAAHTEEGKEAEKKRNLAQFQYRNGPHPGLWCMPVITSLRRLRQDDREFQFILCYMLSPYPKKPQNFQRSGTYQIKFV